MRQLVAALLHLGGRPLEGRGHRRRRELHAGNASRGQDLPLILSELAHAPLDHLAKVFRNADLDLLQHRVQLPPSVAYDAEPARDKVLDEAHHEQGIALGSPVDDARELRWKRVAREALPQVVGAASIPLWRRSSAGSRPTRWAGPRYRKPPPVGPDPTGDRSDAPSLSGLGSESVTPAMNRYPRR